MTRPEAQESPGLRRRARGALVAAVLLSCALATPARIADFDVVCPLFGHRFQAESMVIEGEFSAFDADLCKRSRGQSPYILAVWTCPYCFFSAYQADFRGSVDARFRDLQLRRYPLNPETIRQHEIFVSTKYLNAEAYYREAGRDARFLADLMLRGSYASRVLEMQETAELDRLREKTTETVLAGKARISVEEVELELAAHVRGLLASGAVDDGQRPVYRYLLASALRQGGDTLEAKLIFDEIIEARQLPQAYLRNAEQLSFLCEKEGEFRQKALDYLQQAESAGLIEATELAQVTYLRGELSRRLGLGEQARALFQRAASIPTEEKWIAVMIEKQMTRIAPAAPAATDKGE